MVVSLSFWALSKQNREKQKEFEKEINLRDTVAVSFQPYPRDRTDGQKNNRLKRSCPTGRAEETGSNPQNGNTNVCERVIKIIRREDDEVDG